MKKKIALVKKTRAKKKGKKDITTTSVAFKSDNLEWLKRHELHVRHDLPVSWIVNQLIEKFRDGEIALEVK